MYLKKYGDLATGIVFLAIAVVFYVLAGQLPPSLLGGVGSDFMPKILAVGTGILSVLQMISGVKTMRKDFSGEAAEEEDRPEYVRVLATVVSFGLYVTVMEKVGFLISSVVYLFAQMVILAPKEKRNYVLLAVIAVVFNIVVYFIFRNALNVMLPKGILG